MKEKPAMRSGDLNDFLESLFYNFIVDYKDQNGEDRHGVITAVGANDEREAARGLLTDMEERGLTPQFLTYVPGFHDPDELRRLAKDPDVGQKIGPVKLMYISKEALEFIRS